MAPNHFEGKILNVHPNLAVKINPVFYQLLNGSYEGWFYERFVNLVSFEKQGQHIVDFVDNNSNVYESRVKTIHVYGIDELSPLEFVDFIQKSISNDQFVNLWCDEYYIKDSIRYHEYHFVHPLTVYGVQDGRVYCEFFSTTRGMTLIEVPMDDLRQAYYSIKDYYTCGASYEILKVAMSTYEVKEYNREPFNLTVFNQELSYYFHGQPNPHKKRECWIDGSNVVYGLAYYNDLLEIVRDDNRYPTLPYKCLFDLHLHKLFLLERLKYIRGLRGVNDEFESFVVAFEQIAKMYKRMNMLNLKFNTLAGIHPNVLSQSVKFREKLIQLLEQAYEAESNVIPRIMDYLTNTINKQYRNQWDDFIVEQSDGDIILYPRFDDYISQISVRIGSRIDDAFPVKLQLSNGYCYYPSYAGEINTYDLRPTKLKWIKLTNGKSLPMLHVVRLNDQTETTLDRCSLEHWRPLNHIDHWQLRDSVAKFNINGVDPYLICEGVRIDAAKYPYITVEYGTDDISDQAQFYFMTDASPMYSQDKLMTFHICRSRDRYAYKLDLSNLPAWNNIVTMLRLDPVHYPSQYEGEHIHSECSIYSISVSSAPLIYTNEADYTGCQGVNQWEYCSCKDGIVDHLVYNDRKEVWEHQDGTHIGLDFQTGTNGTFALRNWRCPTQGKYRIVFSAKCDTDTDVYVMLDNHITLYRNEKTNAVHYENIVQVEENTFIQFVSGGGYLKKISIEIQKTLDNR